MNECYESFKAFKSDMQQHAHKQGYAITTKHSKKTMKNEYVIKVIPFLHIDDLAIDSLLQVINSL